MSEYELSQEERDILARIEQYSARSRAEYPLDQRPRSTTDSFPIGVSDDGNHVFPVDGVLQSDEES
jgi:hypothetical protein